MKLAKKISKIIGLLIFIAIIIVAIINTYNWIVCGKQYIKINTSSKAYTNSDLYVSIIAQDKGVDIETKTSLKLLDSKGKKVKNVEIKNEGNDYTLSLPEIEAGNYFLQASVSSKVGADTIKKEIYISKGNKENVTINLDKGIYKPGDIVNFRALLTNKLDDKPVTEDTNICIYDGNDNKVYNENVKSSDYGIISGKFVLANEVNSGLYRLVVKTDNSETVKQFKVNPYVKPKYEVKINYDKQNYLVGDKAKITFNAKYFFGEPAQNTNLDIYINSEKYQSTKTDSEGNASIEYEIKDVKTYNLKVEATDSSNYYVETTSSFTAGTDIFEIEVLPEYGKLVSGKKNDVYVFTKKADGTPLKTYINVISNSFAKQIVTDENGIGKFSIDIDEIGDSVKSDTITNRAITKPNSSSNYIDNTIIMRTKTFSIVAQDSNGNKVEKKTSIDIEKRNLLLSTDKAKYEQGEDINLKISSLNENSKNIYFFRNDRLIKMISTDSDEASINLDDNYGLIDIMVTENMKTSSSYYNKLNSYKRTIFIKPSKQLNIKIATHKEEYKPGEKINIKFEATNEDKTGEEAALLVSMLDNSVLNLANNDLSIDNIKLALQDIKFTNDLDAATLYSCIVDNYSEQTMMALLLKQSDKDLSVSETGMYNYEQKEKSQMISIISIAIIIITILVYLDIKYEKIRKLLKHIINFMIYEVMFVITGFIIVDLFSWSFDYSWWIFGIASVIALATYILFISKLCKKMFRTSISIIITALGYSILMFLTHEFNISPIIIAFVLAVILLIIVIMSKINERKKLKIDKYVRAIVKEIVYILKFALAFAIAMYVGRVFPISIILLYVLNFVFNKTESEDDKGTIKEGKRSIGLGILIVLAIIGFMAVVYVLISTPNGAITFGENVESQPSIGNTDFGGISVSSQSKGNSSILEGLGDIFSSSKKENNSVSRQNKIITDEIETDVESESSFEESNNAKSKDQDSKEENVRNVFLESMCFIPELIAANGTANLNLDLSDNITTWTVQTVGNTKDGRVGYGSLNNVKVFKEFFVDFELPKNLIQSDKVSIPVTVHNYTDGQITTIVKIKEEEWFSLENNNISVTIQPKSTNMVYVPITVLKAGNNKFRVEVSSNTLTDIVEKECTVSIKGDKIEKVVSTGILDEDISEDILFLDDMIAGTAKAKVKIYASTMSQAVEGMENIFRMPTGCFEQVSSSLYPNILALKYLEDNGISNDELRQKALNYISSGYQKLLTYEVLGESGGYSLYGHSPAETVLTAYGLMEIKDLSKVYSVDNNVIEKMTNFLYKKQNINGTFTITGSHFGGASSRENLSLNAYITWGLSEANPNDERLKKSVEYLKGKLDDIDDNYTLALVANVLANVKDKELNNVLKRLVNNVNVEGKAGYIASNITDYYGSRYDVQTIQTVALTSMALSKASYNQDKNRLLVNYLISKKDPSGTWHSTQATVLALKALNERNQKGKLENQTIKVKVNSDEREIEIKDNPLELYEMSFDKLSKENKLNLDIEKGNAYYEVIEEYYVPYDKVDKKNDKIEVSVSSNNELKVNEILKARIKAINRSGNTISNGMVKISIPQGFSVIEESLMLLQSKGIIEKYEISYTQVNIYLRNFDAGQVANLEVWFRAGYPVEITGMAVRVYDYYNPEVQGITTPVEISVK